MKIKRTNRLLAAFISLCMVVGMLPVTAFAEGHTARGLCEHHPEHTAECGYGEAQPCEHEHSEDCYTDGLICGYDEEAETTATDSDAEHTHTQECYALDCPHERGEHDADCGYAEAQPCGYTCELCGKTDNEPEPKPGDETETGQAACTLTEGCTLPAGHEGKCETEQFPANAGSILVTAFDELDDAVRFQTVPACTTLDKLNLPATLSASGYTVDDDSEPVPKTISITGVSWEPTGKNNSPTEYGEERITPCIYYFQPILPEGYGLAEAAVLPEIEVYCILYNMAGRAGTSNYYEDDVDAFKAILDMHPSLKSSPGLSEHDPSSWETDW